MLYQVVGGEHTNGVSWSGVTDVTCKPSGRDKSPLYTKDVKVRTLFTQEEHTGSIQAICYPDAFNPCLGIEVVFPDETYGLIMHHQEHAPFGLCYRRMLGDGNGPKGDYELWLIYNATVLSMSGDSAKTVNTSGDSSIPQFTFEYESVGSVYTIRSDQVSAVCLSALEDVLYGTEDTVPRLPELNELRQIFEMR